MDIIITGAERSATTLAANNYGARLEPKETIAEYRAYMELRRWEDYYPVINTSSGKEKHSLNLDQNIYLLEFLKQKFTSAKFIYVIRDGRDVIKSMYIKSWGRRLRDPGINTRSIPDAIQQWNTVIDKTFHWAQENAEIVKYEDLKGLRETKGYKDVFSKKQIELIEYHIGYNLKRTGYG